MFKWMHSVVDFHSYWFKRAMTEPDINSRVVFLLHGGVTALGILIVAVAFVVVTACTQRPTDHFEHIIMALGGSGAGSAVGRYFTKKNSDDSGAPPVPQAPPQP